MIPVSRKKSILRLLYPRSFADSAYSIDYDGLFEAGYRGLIFDIDNTLVGHDAPADERAVRLAESLKNKGFALCIVSNNHEPRVKTFADALGIPYVFRAGKPETAGYIRAITIMGTSLTNSLAIGDQLITDICGANRTGIFNILVKQMYKKEPFKIRLKRILEKIIMFFYRHEKE